VNELREAAEIKQTHSSVVEEKLKQKFRFKEEKLTFCA